MDWRWRNVSGKVWGSGGRSVPPALLLAVSLLVPAAAAFVTYLRSYGDWSVECALDEPTGYRWCTLQAPSPELYDQRSEVAVSEQRNGALVVTVRVLRVVLAGAPVYLRIDADPPHRAEPDRFGKAAWGGAEAASIVDELARGRYVVLRSFPGEGAEPRDETYSLAGFADALADYRARIGLRRR